MKCNAHKSTSSLTEYSPLHPSNDVWSRLSSSFQMTPNLRQNETAVASAFIPSPKTPIRGCGSSKAGGCYCSVYALLYCSSFAHIYEDILPSSLFLVEIFLLDSACSLLFRLVACRRWEEEENSPMPHLPRHSGSLWCPCLWRLILAFPRSAK